MCIERLWAKILCQKINEIRIGDNPAVVAVVISNEWKCSVSLLFCENSKIPSQFVAICLEIVPPEECSSGNFSLDLTLIATVLRPIGPMSPRGRPLCNGQFQGCIATEFPNRIAHCLPIANAAGKATVNGQSWVFPVLCCLFWSRSISVHHKRNNKLRKQTRKMKTDDGW